MKKPMTVRRAAEEYIHGQELLAEFQSLNNARIGAKFECSIPTVLKAVNGQPNLLSNEDQDLVRQLVAERNRIEREYKRRTYAALSRLTGHSTDRIRIELYLMGYLKEGSAA